MLIFNFKGKRTDLNSGSNQIAASFVNTILTVTKFKSLFLNLSNSCLCKEVVRNIHSIVKHVVYPLIIDSFIARAVMGVGYIKLCPHAGVGDKNQGRFRKTDPDFQFAINNDFVFVSYSFRVNSICLWTWNGVMPVSPLGGVVGQSLMRILKGSPRLPICD